MKEAYINKKAAWSCPANIAIVKYWGKRDVQLPQNPSISFGLTHCSSRMQVSLCASDSQNKIESFLFAKQDEIKFQARLEKFLKSIWHELSLDSDVSLRIESENTFPHSSGIASSASSMGALALCLTELEGKYPVGSRAFYERASYLARLGSGSASRSVYGGWCIWGKSHFSPSCDEYAIPLPDIHENFLHICDTIMVVSESSKAVSSSAGHDLMSENPFAPVRYQMATQHCDQVFKALRSGDFKRFGELCELEALTLHGLMMSSSPPYILLEPNSIALIQEVQNLRNHSELDIYFTIDAGPNIHILYPADQASKVQAYLQVWAKKYQLARVIHDKIGPGPVRLEC